MLDIIAEQPIVLCIGLAVLAAALLFGWLQTGRFALAIAGLVCVLAMPLGWWCSINWVTDREQIRRVIVQTAAAVEANDPPTAAAVIADDKYRQMALLELPRFTFEEARMTGERSIEVDDSLFPPTAEADILVRVKLTGRGFGTVTVPRRLILGFEKIDDQWRVMTYQHLPVVGKADGFSNTLTP